MLLLALLKKAPHLTDTTTDLILRSHGMLGGRRSQGDFVLAEIRDETFREGTRWRSFFATLSQEGLTLQLLTEPNPTGTNEIFYPKNDRSAERALKKLCLVLEASLGPEWRHKQRIWKDQRRVPCA